MEIKITDIAPAEPVEETLKPVRTRFPQPVSKKTIQPGDGVGTCGHVVGGSGLCYLFDGFWKHEDRDIVFLACCPACAVAAGFDLASVKFVDAHVSGESP